MDEIKLWKIQLGTSKARAVSVEQTDQTKTEELLEDILIASPELLMSGLTAIGRQIATPSGPLDLLGIDADGRLVIFELKRGQLTRDAVAQVIDYAACLADFEAADLCSCIAASMMTTGAEKIENFGAWYETTYQRTVRDIGRPKLVLVGLGVDERAKRIVEFLANSGVDIAMITFQGFQEDGKTYLARQVEVNSRADASVIKSGKAANLAKLTLTLNAMGIKAEYDTLFSEIRSGMGESTYPYPYAPGYSFTLPGATPSGGQTSLAHIALYVYEKSPGKIRVNLQPRALKAVGENQVRSLAKEMNAELSLTPAGYGDFFISAKNPVNAATIRRLAAAIGEGWRKERDKEEAKTVEEAKADTELILGT
ncbi:hypothetical protein BH10ACI4_BH10ACI4_22460 [soil metagenome]